MMICLVLNSPDNPIALRAILKHILIWWAIGFVTWEVEQYINALFDRDQIFLTLSICAHDICIEHHIV